MHQSDSKARGFTLIEALVTVAISALVAGFAVPTFRGVLERNAVAGHVNAFVGAANFARSEAMKRGVAVVMCRSSDAETAATPSCAAGADWKAGWMVFADRDGNSSYATVSGDVLLRVQGALADSGGITQSAAAALVFRPNGLMSAGAASVVFNSSSADVNARRTVCLTLGGRTRTLDNSSATCE